MRVKNIFLVIVGIIIISIILVAVDLWNVTEYIPLSHDYDWLAFIGAVLGGMLTLIGVILTLKYQKAMDAKKVRLSVPIF